MAMAARAAAKAGIATRNTVTSEALMRKAMMVADTSMTGARARVRSTMMRAFWVLLMSVVMRVTSDAVLK